MIAKLDDWKRLPCGEMVPIPYLASFDAAEHARIMRGLIPRVMEDKWFCYFDDACLHIHRSWTGLQAFRVMFEPSAGRHAVSEASCATEMLRMGDADYQAGLLDFLIRALLLGEQRPFPRPAGRVEPVPGLFQHVFSGTGFPERITGRKP